MKLKIKIDTKGIDKKLLKKIKSVLIINTTKHIQGVIDGHKAVRNKS